MLSVTSNTVVGMCMCIKATFCTFDTYKLGTLTGAFVASFFL